MLTAIEAINTKLFVFTATTALLVLLIVCSSTASAENLIESDDYKEADFKKCNIHDYSDMINGDDIEWYWKNTSISLGNFKYSVGKVENKSELRSKSLSESVKRIFKDSFDDMDVIDSKGTLTADICIYDAQNANMAKVWIPFAGGHQAQAGVGVELVLKDKGNKLVAKFRHFAREGFQLEAAIQEVVSDLSKFISNN